MSLESEIATLEAALVALRKQLSLGYRVEEVSNGDEYRLYDGHEAIYDIVGNLAGIVINQKVMTKYFESNPYK